MMSRPAFLLLLTALLALPLHASADDAEAAEDMLDEINDMREDEGVAPLRRNPGLDAAARTHSEDMAANQMLDHVSPRTGDPIARVRAAGVQAARVTENIALRPTAEAALQSILASPPHRAQLLSSNVTDIGIGVVTSPRGVYVTQILARVQEIPQEEPLPPPAEAEAVEPPTAPAPEAVAPPTPEVSPEFSQVEPPAPPTVDAQPPHYPEVQPDQYRAAPQQPQYAVPQPQPYTAPQVQVPSSGAGVTVTGQPGQGSVTVMGPDGRRVAGYWVLSRGHWFFYPLPANWHPGMQLQPDLSVQGPPPGYPAQPTQVQVPVRPVAPAVVQPAQPYYYQVVPASPYGRRAMGWRSPRRGASVYVVTPRRR